MQKKYLLALDAGTGSVRAVLFDFNGSQTACVQQEWTHQEDPRYPGSMDFDWTANWELAAGCIREMLRQSAVNPQEIAAISTTCMREGIVLYDENLQEIWACANVDARSTNEVAELLQTYPELEKQLYQTSGQSFALDALPRLLWVKNNLPDIYERTARLGMFNDWLIYKMTGALIIEPSNGSTTGLFNLQKRVWDTQIACKCGVKSNIFPPVKESGSLAGTTSADCQKQTGLAPGTPVIIGGGDAQLGCIGVGVTEANQAAVFGGSFWQYEYNTDSGKTDPRGRIRVNCHALPNLWQYEALAFKPGLAMRWFRDGFCQPEQMEAQRTGKDPYQIMNEKAAEIPAGCYGMMCAFSDVMNFMNWKHAAPTFTNFELDPDKFNRHTFYRAILENTALVTKGHLDLVEEATGNRPGEIVFAGGASKSPLWCQILSDALGLPVKVPKIKEATALGAAIIAGYGAGVYNNISDTARQLVKWDTVYRPNAENHKLYSEMYHTWREVYAAQLVLCDKKLTKNMWIAPGL